MAKKYLKTPGKSHNPDQPVQHIVTVDRGGRQVPTGVCRIELICLKDGSARVFTDDGYSLEGETAGRPNPGRAQLEYAAKLVDDEGFPLFAVREPLVAFDGPYLRDSSDRALFRPVQVALLDDGLRERMAGHIEEREYMLKAAQAQSVVGVVARAPAVDVGGVVESKASKAKPKPAAPPQEGGDA